MRYYGKELGGGTFFHLYMISWRMLINIKKWMGNFKLLQITYMLVTFFSILSVDFFSLGKYLKILERFVFEQYSDFDDVEDLSMSQWNVDMDYHNICLQNILFNNQRYEILRFKKIGILNLRNITDFLSLVNEILNSFKTYS